MIDTVTSYAAHKFGSKARPKIVGLYAGAGGWRDSPSDERLTRESAERLRGEGVTMVRVRHRFRTVEVILRRYLGG